MEKITSFLCAMLMVSTISSAADLTVAGSFPGNSWNNTAVDYKMTEIGSTGVYTLEKTLPSGTYEFKVFNTGTWGGPDSGDNRIFTLDAEKLVKFYAKIDGTTIRFFSDAQQLYVIGAPVGGWDISNKKLMSNTAINAVYTADVIGGDYKIICLDKNASIVWNDITPVNQNVGGTGNYSVKLDYITFSASATSNGSVTPTLTGLASSYIFVGQDPLTAVWYNGSSTFQTEYFNAKNLGSITSALYIGGEIVTLPVMAGVTVKLHYQIGDLESKEIVIPFNSDNLTTSSKWENTIGTNVFSGYSLTNATSYLLKVWFTATDGTVTLYDSNNSANYIASFTYDVNSGLNKTEYGFNVFLENGTIYAKTNGITQVELYTVTGQLIRSELINNIFSQDVKNGAYLLRINGKTQKLLVR